MKRVQDALRPTGIPAFAGAWKATAENPTVPDQYLVYTTQTYETEHWDDALRRYEVYVYLNLWCAGDPTDAIRRVRAAMRGAGFAMREEAIPTTTTQIRPSSHGRGSAGRRRKHEP